MPATPIKNARKGGGRNPLPYTYMYASGLKLGLTTSDLKAMPYMRLVNLIQAWSWTPPEPKDSGTREATQADIRAFFG